MKNNASKTTRRNFLLGTSGALVAGLTSNVALGVRQATNGSEDFTHERRLITGVQRPSAGLFGYIERVAPNMEVFPWRLLCPNFYEIRRVATLTFDRYFEFYQFKKRILESPPSEIEECVQKIDGASSRAKALILTGIYLYDCVYHENSRLFSFQGTRRNYGADYGKMISWSNPDNGVGDPSRYPPNYRYYYPYRFPVCQPGGRVFRPIALIGSYRPNLAIAESTWDRWSSIFERFRNAEDDLQDSIPPSVLIMEATNGSGNNTSARKREQRAGATRIELDERFAEIEKPFLLDPWNRVKIPSELSGQWITIKENVQNWLWNEWLAGIDRLLARVQEILGMKLAATEWATDASETADDFLRTADEFLKDDSATDQEQRDLIAAAREYWASIQRWFDDSNASNTSLHDVLGLEGSRLKDLATSLGMLDSDRFHAGR